MESNSLRLFAWNCAGAFIRKKDSIIASGADIAILSEVSESAASQISEGASGVWIGATPNHGLSVVGMNGWKIERIGIPVEERLFLPVRAVRGSEKLHLVGVCVKPDGDYVTPTLRALSVLSNFVMQNGAILAGDFNQSAKFDAGRSPKRHFARVLEHIDRLGLTSAWHWQNGEKFGEETSPTHFHRWKKDRPFHIDYVFVPRSATVTSAVLGSYDEFTAGGLSDHVPLTIDMLIPASLA